MTYATPDEYSAQLHDVEEAEEHEDALHGRPYEITAVQSGGLFRDLVRDKLGLVSLVFLVVLVLAAIFAPWISPHDPNKLALSDRMLSPVWHGTELGRQLTYGATEPIWLTVIHIVYLVALAVAGWRLAVRIATKRLDA